MKPVDVSVVICTYNHEKYISNAIESVLCQKTDGNFEIIVGDDASIDGTGKILRTYEDKFPVTVIIREKNLGGTRNAYDLIKRAKGRYLVTLDGDDCFDTVDRLQRQMNFLDAHPEYSAVCGKCRLIDEDGCPFPEESMPERARFWKFGKRVFRWEDFEAWNMPGHVSAMMSRNCFLQNDAKILYEAHDTVGDRTMVLFSLMNGEIFCTDDMACCYRIRSGGENFMAKYATKNLRGKDFRMMKYLERYANSKGHRLDLSEIKKQRLVGAVCVWMKESSKKNFHIICEILELESCSAEYMTLVVKTLILKSYYWNTLHEDYPIDVK